MNTPAYDAAIESVVLVHSESPGADDDLPHGEVSAGAFLGDGYILTSSEVVRNVAPDDDFHQVVFVALDRDEPMQVRSAKVFKRDLVQGLALLRLDDTTDLGVESIGWPQSATHEEGNPVGDPVHCMGHGQRPWDFQGSQIGTQGRILNTHRGGASHPLPGQELMLVDCDIAGPDSGTIVLDAEGAFLGIKVRSADDGEPWWSMGVKELEQGFLKGTLPEEPFEDVR